MKRKIDFKKTVTDILIAVKQPLSKREWSVLDRAIRKIIPSAPRIPKPLWRTAMSRAVPTSIELVLMSRGRVLLTERSDLFFKGAHFPGTYLCPGETFLMGAARCAKRELGVKVTAVRFLGAPVNHPGSKRFHDCSLLFQCEFSGIPSAGAWHSKKPKSLLEEHRAYWKYVAPLLSSK